MGNRGRAAAFFDLDKTIIATSSTLAFSRPFFANGLISRASVIRSMYAQLVLPAGRCRPRPDGAHAALPQRADERVGGRHRPPDRRRNAALDRRPAGVRRGAGADPPAPAGRPRGRHRLDIGLGRGRADRRAARGQQRHGDPTRGARRPLHRRDRVLRVRREQGQRRSASSRRARDTTCGSASPTATRRPTSPC